MSRADLAPVDFFSVSASAIKTHRMCPRKNAFDRYYRLPKVPKGHFAFGTTLHECVERWLLADEHGRDENGQPVNIYPEGWDKAVSPAEGAQIKRLIERAIDDGHLVRYPERQVERQMGINPRTGEGTPFWVVKDKINMFGFIDIDHPNAIDDLKTTKSPRYILGPKKLKSDTQMLIYAKHKLEEIRSHGNIPPPFIELSHVVFCKDPANEFTRRTTVEVTPKEIDAAWTEIVVDSEAMLEVRKKVDAGVEWHDLQGPEPGSNACGAYGGCDYQSICGGAEKVEAFIERVNAIRENPKNAHLHQAPTSDNPVAVGEIFSALRTNDETPDKPEPQGGAVSLARFKNKMKSGNSAAVPAKQSPLTAPEPEVEKPSPFAQANDIEAEQARLENAAPWYVEGCTACSNNKHLGFNSQGNPCGACNQLQKKAGGTVAADYDFGMNADGTPWWREAETAPIPEPEPVHEPEPTMTEEPKKRGRGRPKKTDADRAAEEAADRADPWNGIIPKGKKKAVVGITLLRGSAPQRTDRMTLDLATIFPALAEELAKENGVADFYSLDTWKRRENLAQIAILFLDGVRARFSPNAILYSTSANPDLMALVDGIAGHVDEVIVGANT